MDTLSLIEEWCKENSLDSNRQVDIVGNNETDHLTIYTGSGGPVVRPAHPDRGCNRETEEASGVEVYLSSWAEAPGELVVWRGSMYKYFDIKNPDFFIKFHQFLKT